MSMYKQKNAFAVCKINYLLTADAPVQPVSFLAQLAHDHSVDSLALLP